MDYPSMVRDFTFIAAVGFVISLARIKVSNALGFSVISAVALFGSAIFSYK